MFRKAVALGFPVAAAALSQRHRPTAVDNPGRTMTRARLALKWQRLTHPCEVLDFYGHKEEMGDRAVFSNFYRQSPFTFVVPECVCAIPLSLEDRSVECTFSEKPIMLCKAAAHGDEEAYFNITKADTPGDAKKLGRMVKNKEGCFDDVLWREIECSVAFEVVFQKFSKTDKLRKILLDHAGDKTIFAEMTSKDVNWGTGMDIEADGCNIPANWPGSNMLGWAINEVADILKQEPDMFEK